MERLLFWIKNCLVHNNRACKGFCVTCRHYHLCSKDGTVVRPSIKGLGGRFKHYA